MRTVTFVFLVTLCGFVGWCSGSPVEPPAKSDAPPVAPTPVAPVPKKREIHVSPDGTVNELHPDGVYRPIPGEPKRKPTATPGVVAASPFPATSGTRVMTAPFAAGANSLSPGSTRMGHTGTFVLPVTPGVIRPGCFGAT